MITATDPKNASAPGALWLAAAAAALLAAGCGGEPTEITDVNPVESTGDDEPEMDDSRADAAGTEPAIGEESAADDMITRPDKTLFAEAEIASASDSDVGGTIRFNQDGELLRIEGQLVGLSPGRHGLHIHTEGDCSAPDASSAGGHFAPDDDPHGSPREPDERHHVGDLGNFVADENGVAEVSKTDLEMTLAPAEDTIAGRAVIIHAEADDLASQPSGDAGARVGCGVVQIVPDPAYRI